MQAQRGNRPIAVLIFNIGAGKGRYIYAQGFELHVWASPASGMIML